MYVGVLSLYQAELGREGIEEGDWTYPKTTLEVSILCETYML